MNKLAIYGAGGHGKVIADTAELLGWQIIHFYDENHSNYPQHELWDVVGGVVELSERLGEYDGVIVAIGNNKIRLTEYNQLKKLGAQLITLVHPQAIVSRRATLGNGSVVFAGAVVNAFTKIGEASIINTSASVDHDCDLGDAVHICPGTHLAGNVTVGDFGWIGLGSSVIQQIDITNDVFVGAGSVIVDNIERSGTYFGNPARLVE